MNYSGHMTKLKLAYAPLSNHDFAKVKSEKDFQDAIKGSMLYVITQRPMLSFENVRQLDNEPVLAFDIRQQGSSAILECILPLYQELLGYEDKVNVEFGSHDRDWSMSELPMNGVHGFKFFDEQMQFLLWLTPEKFLHHYLNGLIDASVQGDVPNFSRYQVLYVGKAADQEVWQRLTGHYTLREILSLERALHYGTLPTHEITLLLLSVADQMTINILDDDVDKFVEAVLGENAPSIKTTALDAEKVLIKVLDPRYNDPGKRFP